MRRCLELLPVAVSRGELPFASLVTRRALVIAEATSTTRADADLTRHAEANALQQARTALGSADLSECSLFASSEPCAMCAFMLREYKVGRVLFAARSASMGGFSRWDILQDRGLATLTGTFAAPPEVIAGLLESEATALLSTFRRGATTT